MPSNSIVEELLRSLTGAVRGDVLREANVQRRIEQELDKRGFLLAITPDEARNLAVPLLRRVRIEDSQFRQLASEANIRLRGRESSTSVQLRFLFGSAGDSVDALPVTQLTATSLIAWELSFRVKQTLEAIGAAEELNPPQVTVKAGSANYSFSGGPLLVAGIALIVAAHTAIPPGTGADFAYWGGALATSLGMIESVLGWRRTLAETDKLQSETALNHVRIQNESNQPRPEPPPPPASLIPEATLTAEARALEMEPAIGAHIINQVMPAYDELSRHYGSPIKAEGGASGRAASASRGF
jgi:hypothetical protein